jgi:hypothetical protein
MRQGKAWQSADTQQRNDASTQATNSDQSSMHHPNTQAAASMFGAVRMADLPSSYRPRFSLDTMTSIVE